MKNYQKLRNEADNLWYIIIIKNYPICESCGELKSIQAHHYYYKSSVGHLRYSLNNGIGLCKKCHFLLHHGKDPKIIEDKIIIKRSSKWLKKLQKEKDNKPKYFKTNIKWYEGQIKRLAKYLQ